MKKNKKLIAIIFSIIIISLVSIVLAIGIVRTSVIKNVAQYKTSSTSAIEEIFEYSELENGTIEITKYVGTDTIVEIPSTIDGKNVTTIGDSAFYGCTGLNNITIPEGVTSIGSKTFCGCVALVNIIIPKTITTIGDSAFDSCISLASIEIPEGTTSIGSRTFYGCVALTKITIPKTITTIGEKAFYACTSLNSITIPEGVTSIEEETFEGCQSLTQITIPESVVNIGEYAFSGCMSLTNITIPKNVTSVEGTAFSVCISLENINVDSDNEKYCDINGVLYTNDMTQIIKYPVKKQEKDFTIPKEVTTICDDAFEYCSSLTNITIPKSVTSIGNGAFYTCIGLNDITIPEGVTTIEYETFGRCSSLTNITIPKNVRTIQSQAFFECKNLENINVDSDNENYCDVNGVLYTKDRTEIVKYPEGKKEKEYTILEGVTTIGYEAFKECSSLNNITIPKSVTNIESYAFEGCSSLTNIIIPEGITQINWNLFERCTSLTNITIPDGVTSIGQNAFNGCSSLTNITIPDGVTRINYNAFNGCSSLTNITIPDGVTSIRNNVFKGCSKLTNITIPESITDIEYEAFEGCSGLTSIIIPEGVKYIGHSAFKGCTNLANITIPKSVTSIGGQAFGECSSLENINVDSDNKNYCDINGVLYTKDMTELKKYPEGKKEIEYTLPKSITYIESNALIGCSNLEKINVESDNENYCDINGVLYTKDKTEIVQYPSGRKETEFVIPNTVTSISWGQFYNCNNLISIKIHKSVTNIEEGAFYRCNNLKNINVENNNENYCDINGVLYSKDKKELIAYPAGKEEIKFTVPNHVTNIWIGAFAKCNKLKEITISSGVKNLMPGALMECESLTNVIIPEGVVGLMPFAFYESNNIEKIVIPSSVTAIFYFLEDEEYEKYTRATINCKSNTIAEKYAKVLNCPYVIDDEKPIVTIMANDESPKIGEKIIYTFTFSEQVVGFEAEDITISNGEKGEFKQISETEYTLEVTYNESGTKELSIQEGTYTDLVGNKNAATEPYEIRVIEPQSIFVSTNPQKVTYNAYENFNKDGMVVSIKYDNGDIEETTEYTIINEENLTCKVSKIEIQYNKKSELKTELPITVGHNYQNGKCTECGKEEPKIKITSNTYKIEETNISKIKTKMTIKTFKENIQTNATEIKVYNKEGEEQGENNIVATGMTIILKMNNETKTSKLIVAGDVTGDGKADFKDMVVMNKHRLKKTALEGEYLIAGDVTEDNKLDFKDMVKINKFRLNKIAELFTEG